VARRPADELLLQRGNRNGQQGLYSAPNLRAILPPSRSFIAPGDPGSRAA